MATTVTSSEFLTWAAAAGLGFDPRYPSANDLCLLPPRTSRRFWVLPDDPRAWPHFVGVILAGLDRWESGFLWPHAGRWPAAAFSPFDGTEVRDVILRGAGVPDGWAGAVRYTRGEQPAAAAAMIACLAFGLAGDDLSFVPDHGRQVVRTDHHDVIHVECADEGRVAELVRYMDGEGYPLPEEPPDETFRRPHWMPRPAAGPDPTPDRGGAG